MSGVAGSSSASTSWPAARGPNADRVLTTGSRSVLVREQWNERPDDQRVGRRSTEQLPDPWEISRAQTGDRRNNGIIVRRRGDLTLGHIVQRAADRDGVDTRHADGDGEVEGGRGLRGGLRPDV